MGKMIIAVAFALAGTAIFLLLIRRLTFDDAIIVPLVGITFGGIVQAATVYFAFQKGLLQSLPVTVSGSRAAFTKGVLCVEDFDVGLLDDKVLYEALKRNV